MLYITSIRVFEDCDIRYRKNLSTTEPYVFKNDIPDNFFGKNISIHAIVKLIPTDNKDTNSLKLLIKVDAKLKLNELYKCFNNVVEDIIWKKQYYSKDLVDGLQRQFLQEMSDLYRGIDRFILGYSTDEDDIYKRPLTKMVQDVSRQLNLIR